MRKMQSHTKLTIRICNYIDRLSHKIQQQLILTELGNVIQNHQLKSTKGNYTPKITVIEYKQTRIMYELINRETVRT